MLLPRVFIASELKLKKEIILDIDLSNYLLNSIRLKISDHFLIFNGTSPEGEFSAIITAINKQRVVAVVQNFIQCNRESPLQIHLGQGISRGEKMDFTVQKAVELGVNIITPLFTEYCNVKLKNERLENRLHHWQAIAISAAQQSGRCYIPKILPAQFLESWVVKANNLRLVFDPTATNKLANIKEHPGSVTLLIGPEGGLSNEEIVFAKQNNFLPVILGPRILRTETSGLAAISALQTQWGDF